MNTKSLLKYNMREYVPVLILGFILAAMSIVTKGKILDPRNITNIMFQNSYYLVLALGMLFIMKEGKIDLSVGSQMTFTGAVFYIFAIKMNIGLLPSILVCLIAGTIIGAFQGFLIAYFKLPSSVVSIVVLLVLRYLSPVLLERNTIQINDIEFFNFMNKYLPDSFLGVNNTLLTLFGGLLISAAYLLFEFVCYKKKKKNKLETLPLSIMIIKAFFIISGINILTYIFSLNEGMPYVFLLITILILVYAFALEKVNTQPVDNDQAGYALNKRRILLAFVNMGILSVAAGLLFLGRIGAISQFAGNKLEVKVILACLIGGASIARRIGKVRGVVIGVLICGIMMNGFALLGISSIFQDIVLFVFLVLAVALEVYLKTEDKKLKNNAVSINP